MQQRADCFDCYLSGHKSQKLRRGLCQDRPSLCWSSRREIDLELKKSASEFNPELDRREEEQMWEDIVLMRAMR